MNNLNQQKEIEDNRQRVDPNEFKIVPTKRDGNCFFNAYIQSIEHLVIKNGSIENHLWNYIKDFSDKSFTLRKLSCYLFVVILLKKKTLPSSSTHMVDNLSPLPSNIVEDRNYLEEEDDALLNLLYKKDYWDKINMLEKNAHINNLLNKAFNFDYKFKVDEWEIRTSSNALSLLVCFLTVNNIIPETIVEYFITEENQKINDNHHHRRQNSKLDHHHDDHDNNNNDDNDNNNNDNDNDNDTDNNNNKIDNDNYEIVEEEEVDENDNHDNFTKEEKEYKTTKYSKNEISFITNEVSLNNFRELGKTILKERKYSHYLEKYLIRLICIFIENASKNSVHVPLWIFGSLTNSLFSGIFRIKYAIIENENSSSSSRDPSSSSSNKKSYVWASKSIGNISEDKEENIWNLFNYDNFLNSPFSTPNKHTLYYLDHSPIEHFDSIFKEKKITPVESHYELDEPLWDFTLFQSVSEFNNNNNDNDNDYDDDDDDDDNDKHLRKKSIYSVPIFEKDNDDDDTTTDDKTLTEKASPIIVSKYAQPKRKNDNIIIKNKNDDDKVRFNELKEQSITDSKNHQIEKHYKDNNNNDNNDDGDNEMEVDVTTDNDYNTFTQPLFFKISELGLPIDEKTKNLNDYIQYITLLETPLLSKRYLIQHKAYLFIKEAKRGMEIKYSPLGEMSNISSIFQKEDRNSNILIYNFTFFNEEWKRQLLMEMKSLSYYFEVFLSKRGSKEFHDKQDFKDFNVIVYYNLSSSNDDYLLKEVLFKSHKWSNLNIIWNINYISLKDVKRIFLVIVHKSIRKEDIHLQLSKSL